MTLSLSLYIALMITGILWFTGGLVIWPNYKKSGNKSVGDFAKTLLWAGPGLIIMISNVYYLRSILPMGWFTLIFASGAFVKSVAILYLVKLLFRLIGKYQKVAWRITIFVFVSFFIMKFTDIVGLILKGKSGVIFPKVALGYYFMGWFGPVVIISVVWLLVKSLMNRESNIKIRGILVTLALLLYFVNLEACGIAGIIKPFVFNWPTAIGTISIMVAIIYISKIRRPEQVLVSTPRAVSNNING